MALRTRFFYLLDHGGSYVRRRITPRRAGRAAAVALILWWAVGLEAAGSVVAAKIPDTAERFGEVHWYPKEASSQSEDALDSKTGG